MDRIDIINLSKKNGLLRLNDILCHSNVSMSAGTDPGILSFQRGYLPILKVRHIPKEKTYILRSL